jgi:glycosyltransferase involved in cell wall biosynthesis
MAVEPEVSDCQPSVHASEADAVRPCSGGDFAVCVLAHNEESAIERTLFTVIRQSEGKPFPVYVYANGCTDRTEDVVRRFALTEPRVNLRTSGIASKPLAWNTAFEEQQREFIVFSDGDISPEPGAAARLVRELTAAPAAVLATCRQVPRTCGLVAGQRLVGYMQTPLVQDFLAGGFYAVRREALSALLEEHGLTGLPAGITGDDCFLDALVGAERLVVSECRTFYDPPDLGDYCRYLARIRWQNEQLALVLPSRGGISTRGVHSFARKVRRSRAPIRFLRAVPAVALRYLFRLIAAPAINRIYRSLGPVSTDGAGILSLSTRSSSSRREEGS